MKKTKIKTGKYGKTYLLERPFLLMKVHSFFVISLGVIEPVPNTSPRVAFFTLAKLIV